jgi:predicted RNA binding protein YcfA (HicA-like mRNA interferase family)
MPKPFSGKAVIDILIGMYGFRIAGKKGSHVKLKKVSDGETIITVVPLHRELAHGTLRSILRLAKIEYEDFLKRA